MTICIAAIGQSKDIGKDCEAIVFATDHMITIPNIGQFEHSIEKYRRIGTRIVAMLSGEALLFDSVLKGVNQNDELVTVADKIHRNMIEIRNSRIEKSVFEKFRVPPNFLGEALKLPVQNDLL